MNKKYIILGFTLPEYLAHEILLEDSSMPIQTFKFANNLKRSLEYKGDKVFLISTHPVCNYPNNSRIVFKYNFFTYGNSNGFTIPFLNLILLKHLSRFTSGFLLANSLLKKSKHDVIVTHGIHSPFLLISYFMKKIYDIKIVCIITDPPYFSEEHSYFEKIFRKIDKSFISFLLGKMDGLITLSELFVKDNLFENPYIVLDGFVSNEIEHDSIKQPSPIPKSLFRFAYAGGLNEEYGVKALVEAAMKVDGIELYLYGKGTLHSYLLKVAETNKNIKYEGFLLPDQLKAELLLADCLVNPRPSHPEFVRYSFPSKIIEYMSLGVPLLTTKLPSLSDDYLPYIYIIENETNDGIAYALTCVSKVNPVDLKGIGKSGKDFVNTTRSSNAQGARLHSFINSL